GAFFGVWFDLFEQFFHYSNLLADNISSQSIVNSLIYTRSVYPLHCVTTMIASLGLGIVFINRRNLKKGLQVLISTIFILLATCLHGLWNYYSISQLDPSSQFATLTTIGITSIGVFAVFVMFLLLYKPKICESCNTEHASGSCVELSYDLEEISKILSKKRKIIPLLQNSHDMIMCSQCQNKTFNGNFCINCWSFPKLQCNNCNQVLPSYTRICWSCGTEVPTLYTKMTSSSPSFYVNLSVGLTRILGAGMFISFIFSFATLRETIFTIGSLSSMGNIILLLGVILSLLVTIIWYAYSDNKVKSMISSMNLISIAAISIIITGLYLSVFAFLMIITVAQIVMGLIGLFCILLITTVSVIYLLKIMKGARLIII
ncbi:MAG: PrsW family glutamic-type intramembrane protease, partial [Candidatus Heimdallarchaeaceae archaeon]